MSYFTPYVSVLQSFSVRRLNMDRVFLALCALHDIRATEIPAYDRAADLFCRLQERYVEAGQFRSLIVVSPVDQTRWEQIKRDIRSEVALEGKLERYEASLVDLAERCEVEEEPLLDRVGRGDVPLVDCLLYCIAFHLTRVLERA